MSKLSVNAGSFQEFDYNKEYIECEWRQWLMIKFLDRIDTVHGHCPECGDRN